MKKRRRRGRNVLLVLLAILVLTGAALADSNLRIVTTEYEVSPAGLPEGFDGFRIAVVSDLHGKRFETENARLAADLREASPDLIAVTGDLFDQSGQLDYVYETISMLLTVAPVYYVTGNHEWATGDALEAMSLIETLGARVLRNETEVLTRGGDRIVLCGVDDPNGFADMETPAEVYAMGAASGAECSVLLAHRNTELDEYAAAGFDLVLCGHGHGGIVRMPFIGGLFSPYRTLFPRRTAGVETIGGTLAVISRGLGNVYGIPRLLNNPEIVVVTLKTAGAAENP
jgi:predicted MPP superfamily phosphohydrolase